MLFIIVFNHVNHQMLRLTVIMKSLFTRRRINILTINILRMVSFLPIILFYIAWYYLVCSTFMQHYLIYNYYAVCMYSMFSECRILLVFISLFVSLSRFGRKPVLIATMIAEAVFNIFEIFSPNWMVFCIFFFFTGFSHTSNYVTAFVLGKCQHFQ